MRKHKVLIIATSIRPEGIRLLESVASLTFIPDHASQEETAQAATDADAILARTGRVTRRVIEAAPRLKIVARHGVGYDNVDVQACTEHGVVVTITGDANSEAVSEHTMGCLLAAARQIPLANAAVKRGIWERDSVHGIELAGKTLGLVGLGRIGSRVARHAQGFDMRVIAHDPYADPERARGLGVTLVSLEMLLREADFVSLHVPLMPQTRHMIGAEQLMLMKPSAILVNTSRGGLIDEAALCQALAERRIAGVALDVFEQEPLPPDHPFTHLDNVICTPHVGGQTDEALIRMAVSSAESILRVLRGEKPDYIVNPEVLQNTTRVAWKSPGA